MLCDEVEHMNASVVFTSLCTKQPWFSTRRASEDIVRVISCCCWGSQCQKACVSNICFTTTDTTRTKHRLTKMLFLMTSPFAKLWQYNKVSYIRTKWYVAEEKNLPLYDNMCVGLSKLLRIATITMFSVIFHNRWNTTGSPGKGSPGTGSPGTLFAYCRGCVNRPRKNDTEHRENQWAVTRYVPWSSSSLMAIHVELSANGSKW